MIVSEPEQPGRRRGLWLEEYEESRDDAEEKKFHEGRCREAVEAPVHGEAEERKRDENIGDVGFPDYEACPQEEPRDPEEDNWKTLGLEPRGTTRKRDN